MKKLLSYSRFVESFLEKKDNEITKIDESVASQRLLHYTTLSNLYLILKTNTMYARSVSDNSRELWTKVSTKSISFSRRELTKNQLYGVVEGQSEPLTVNIEFDYDKLKNNYKIVPWSDNRSKDSSSSLINQFQYEERCTTDIKNVRKYIKSITIYDATADISWEYGGKGEISGELPFREFLKSDFLSKNLYDILTYTDKKAFRNEQNIISMIEEIAQQKTIHAMPFMNSKIFSYLWANYLYQEIKNQIKGIRLNVEKKIGKDLFFTDDIEVLVKKMMKEDYINDFKKQLDYYVDRVRKNIRDNRKSEKETKQELKDKLKQQFIDSITPNRHDIEERRKKLSDYESAKSRKETSKLRRTLAKKINESQIFKDFKSQLYKKIDSLADETNLEELLNELYFKLSGYEENQEKNSCYDIIRNIQIILNSPLSTYQDVKDIIEKIDEPLRELTISITGLIQKKSEERRALFQKFLSSKGKDNSFEKSINEINEMDTLNAQNIIEFIFFSKDKKTSIERINQNLFDKFIQYLKENKEFLLLFMEDDILERIKDIIGRSPYGLSFLTKNNVVEYYRQISNYIKDEAIDNFLKNNTI